MAELIKKLKLPHYAAIAIVTFLLITNPSLKRFDEFVKSEDFYSVVLVKTGRLNTGRLNNFFLFSIYISSCPSCEENNRKKKYIGAMSNFIEISSNSSKINQSQVNQYQPQVSEAHHIVNKKLYKVYEYLSNAGKLPSNNFEEFEEAMKNEKKLSKVYDYLKAKGKIKSTSLSEFKKEIGLENENESLLNKLEQDPILQNIERNKRKK